MVKTQVVLLVAILASFAQVGSAQWGNWGAWSSCSVTCQTGSTVRERVCSGGSCVGNANETLTCTIMNYCIPSYYGNTDRTCGVDYFGCATGVTTCVNITLRCDGNQDCEDASDENPYYAGCTDAVCNKAVEVGQSAVMTMLILAFAAILQTM